MNDESAQPHQEEFSRKPTPDWDVDDAPKMPTKVKDLFDWKSPSHQKREYPREFFTTLIAIATLLSIIFAFFQEWAAIIVTWAALFLFYALSKVQPQTAEHRITTQGIITLNQTFLWGELGVFWFTERGGDTFLHVATRNIFGQVMIIINKADKDEIRDILAHYLPFVEVWEKSTTEKISDWFAKKFPVHRSIPAEHQDLRKAAETAPLQETRQEEVKTETMNHPAVEIPKTEAPVKNETEEDANPATLQQKFADKPIDSSNNQPEVLAEKHESPSL